jgi:hypothetical protein
VRPGQKLRTPVLLAGRGEIESWEIFDLSGRTVSAGPGGKNTQEGAIIVPDVPPGMYILRLGYEGGKKTSGKFLVVN